MDHPFHERLLFVCKLLEKHEVRYLIIGGAAVALYGYFRLSMTSAGKPAEKPDIDLWYDPTYDNYFKLLKVVAELGQDVARFRDEKTPDPRRSFFKLDLDNMTIDLLPEVPGLARFKDAYERRAVVQVAGQNITFIDLDDLITSKQALQRDKDVADIEELKKRHKE